MTIRRYAFGEFVLDPAARELRRNGSVVPLPARAFDVLAYLIEHRDRAVGRDELISAVWGRVEISAALLNHTVVRIRRTLDDTGNEQRTVRTVARFGYRWVEETRIEDDEAIAVAPPRSEAVEAEVPATAPRVSRRRPALVVIGLLAIVLVIVVVAVYVTTRDSATTDTRAVPIADAALPAMVLPAVVDAPVDWAWLRLGLMDLVANRLRDGQLRTLPSESVVGLLKQRATSDGDALLQDASLADIAALRVLPHVRLADGIWFVRLDARDGAHAVSVDAQSPDAIMAAREAADRLLTRLGYSSHAFYGDNPSPAVVDLLQRTGAAMLADQLAQARDTIEHAAPDLQQQPEIQQRMAQIELRSGDYPAVERRLTPLLDRLSPQKDARLRARVLLTLATSFVRRNQNDRAGELYDEVLALPQASPDPEVLGIARLGRGLVLAQKSGIDEATAELGRARIALQTSGDRLAVATVDVNLGDFQMVRHRPADALPMLKSASAQYQQLGAREGFAHVSIAQANAHADLLEHAAALAAVDAVWPPETHTNNLRMRWSIAHARAEALAALGHFDEAQALIERVRTESDPVQDAGVRVAGETLAASIAWSRRDFFTASRLVDSTLLNTLAADDPAGYASAALLASRSQRRVGNPADAAKPTLQLRDAFKKETDDWHQAYAALADAEQSWADGSRDAALQLFGEANRHAQQVNVPSDVVAVGVPYIEALIASHRLDEAQAVGGRIALWADRDASAAWAQVRLFHALGQTDAERRARDVALRLSGGLEPPEIIVGSG